MFCRPWIISYLETSPLKQCPMCRTKLSIENFNPKVDQEVWNDIKSLFPEEIKERAKEVEEDIKKVSAFKIIS